MSSSSWKVEFQFSQYLLPEVLKTEPVDSKDADEILFKT